MEAKPTYSDDRDYRSDTPIFVGSRLMIGAGFITGLMILVLGGFAMMSRDTVDEVYTTPTVYNAPDDVVQRDLR